MKKTANIWKYKVGINAIIYVIALCDCENVDLHRRSILQYKITSVEISVIFPYVWTDHFVQGIYISGMHTRIES